MNQAVSLFRRKGFTGKCLVQNHVDSQGHRVILHQVGRTLQNRTLKCPSPTTSNFVLETIFSTNRIRILLTIRNLTDNPIQVSVGKDIIESCAHQPHLQLCHQPPPGSSSFFWFRNIRILENCLHSAILSTNSATPSPVVATVLTIVGFQPSARCANDSNAVIALSIFQPGRSDLLITKISAISMMPALIV